MDSRVPHAMFVENERTRSGAVEAAATAILVNRECPFRCVMCDLWKNTTDHVVPVGDVAGQVRLLRERYPEARTLKLYNAGSLFDPRAVSDADLAMIGESIAGVDTVVVECHPRFVGSRCFAFAEAITARLEVAIGLETVDPVVLPRLNKAMDLADFDAAVHALKSRNIDVRAFILLRTPWQSEEEGLRWAGASVEHAFAVGVDVCVVIPTRAGNGIMESLAARGDFGPPLLRSLEAALDAGLSLRRGRVFVDLWDASALSSCTCGDRRVARMHRANHEQEVLPPVACGVCG